MNYIKENIITKLQKLNSQPRNLSADSKSTMLFLKKPFAWTIYYWHEKYSMKDLISQTHLSP